MAGITEGVSFIILLCIAMPLKYFFDLPMAVKIVGWLHGILFIAFISLAYILVAGMLSCLSSEIFSGLFSLVDGELQANNKTVK